MYLLRDRYAERAARGATHENHARGDERRAHVSIAIESSAKRLCVVGTAGGNCSIIY